MMSQPQTFEEWDGLEPRPLCSEEDAWDSGFAAGVASQQAEIDWQCQRADENFASYERVKTLYSEARTEIAIKEADLALARNAARELRAQIERLTDRGQARRKVVKAR